MVIHPLLLKLHQVIGDPKRGVPGLIPMGRSTWYAGIRSGTYPAGVKIGKRSIAWRYSDITALAKKLGGEA